MKKIGRPKGSKNQPVLFKKERAKKLDTIRLSRESLRVVHDLANDSGVSPQMVLEDLILAGSYSMGEAYSQLSNLRKRFKEKSLNRKNVTPVTSIQTSAQNGTNGTLEGNTPVAVAARDEYVPARPGPVLEGSFDVTGERGHRPEDNPAFRDPGATGDVIGTAPVGPADWSRQAWIQANTPPDPGPVETDEEGNPLEPQPGDLEQEELDTAEP